MKFSHFSKDKTLTLNKLIFNYKNNIKNFKPNGFWFSFKNLWYTQILVDMKEPNEKIYKYIADIDMKNIFILTEKNVKKFFTKYQIKLSDTYVVNWKKFIKNYPKCKGVFLNFNPHNTIFARQGTDSINIEPYILWLSIWDISSLCLFDKSAIINFIKVPFRN
jgi:hypothetical protein